jgi:hypothetical protein
MVTVNGAWLAVSDARSLPYWIAMKSLTDMPMLESQPGTAEPQS